jgi:hypothetical protein
MSKSRKTAIPLCIPTYKSFELFCLNVENLELAPRRLYSYRSLQATPYFRWDWVAHRKQKDTEEYDVKKP